MPQDHDWALRAPNFHFKPQDYVNSCFSACLQMAMANFGIIAPVGRPIEDQFNNYMTNDLQLNNLDVAAPTPAQVQNFILNTNFLGKDYLTLLNCVDNIDENAFKYIKQLFQLRRNIALIGAIRVGGGHATAIIKCKGFFVAINPAEFEGNCVPTAFNNIVSIDVNDNIVGIDCNSTWWSNMDYCYIISNR